MKYGLLPLTSCLLILCQSLAQPADLSANEKSSPAAQVDFAKQIRPLFQAKCYSCHGREVQEGGFRLDLKSRALEGGDSGVAIKPGKSHQSELFHRVAGTGDGDKMPPEGEGTPLSKEELALVKTWIEQGATWPEIDGQQKLPGSDHWSFQPIQDVKPPQVQQTDWVKNGIDAFILRKLEQEKVTPSPEADRSTLIRRVYLDLTGLPPSVEEWKRWSSDPSPQWYESMVDHLLDSPHYGERWARHWLDLARYADSDGYEKDSKRPHAWRWRTWVINALNSDMPFDQFSIEQLAGDLLPDPETSQLVATGFHRNTLINREGGTDPEEDRVKRTVDRTNTMGSVWLGMTVECGQCHTHKYDPLTQREYYRLYAFFNSLTEPDIGAPLPEERAAFEKANQVYQKAHAPLVKAVQDYEQHQLADALAKWEQQKPEQKPVWTILQPDTVQAKQNTTLSIQPDRSILASGENPGRAEIYTITFKTDLQNINGIRLEALTDPSLPHQGPGRSPTGDFELTMLTLKAAPLDSPEKATEVKLEKAQASFEMAGYKVDRVINNSPHTGWSISPQEGKKQIATFETKEPFGGEKGTFITVSLQQSTTRKVYHNLGRFRLSLTTGKKPLPLTGMTDLIVETLNTPVDERTPIQKAELLEYYRTIDPQLKKLKEQELAHRKQAPKNPAETTKAQVVDHLKTPRKTHLLVRGDFLNPADEVKANTPAVLPPLQTDNPTRLDLARWLFDPRHPLTARVTVNRIWSRYFGRGLVPTINDFGTQGEAPSHPELLDWLATQFRDQDWSLKQLHRLIVTSATYRQSSEKRPELAERDPYNTWLSHQNRLRIEGEIIRDEALSVSGLIKHKIGGRSVNPPQPEGIASLGYANSVKWPTSKGDDRYRRGLYTFFQRTVPYPMLMTFDSPDSNLSCTRRERSNTPLQALTIWNDPVFFECSQSLGSRIVSETQGKHASLDQRIQHAFELCLTREPTASEMKIIKQLYQEQTRLLKSDPKLVSELTNTQKIPAGSNPQEIAAWIIIGRVLLNLDEFVTRG
ncbi:PSD1 and planctomycete cytochrome C domain-containing protein [Gimesia panareensis]|uniref:PSD1 and planctomycete cytochrome C domain-containing protein n=1 Tax=Gimesia panareensis TaxID=2527978 RepID=UPI00118A1D2A|nr:PSD1 and planctomycete cytochrome C domain-containing protein [Gimesia panareensis]QDU50934.1 Planctomycete cytochrome C [Gimesia panareensis]